VRAWYARLPIHRRLVVVAMAVTTIALTLAVASLVAVDLWRYRALAKDDTATLARVIAENVAAAVIFENPEEAQDILATAGVRESVPLACLYLPDGTLFARFERSSGDVCPRTPETPTKALTVTGTSPIVRGKRTVGLVYVERRLLEFWTSVTVAVLTGLLVLIVAGALSVPIANRLQRRISEPITQLALAAGRVQPDAPQPLPPIKTELNEITQLVTAFADMLERIRHANDALRTKETEREELLRREQQASRLKDEFLAAVSHELRTPLNAISGWAQILTMAPGDAATTEKAAATIARNTKAQARLIDDLVDVSRIAAGKLTVKNEPIDLREPIELAVDVCRASAVAKKIDLTIRLGDHVCLVRGDRDRLQQIVGNLLSNAIKFTDAGGSVSIEMLALDRAYEISISDTGIGIAADFLPFVFDRFRQADGTITREHGGLGLGLAIVKELTALHGGSVSVESAGRHKGSTFKVRLPALIEPASLADDESNLARFADDALAGVRILAVDDNPDALEVLERALAFAGATVRTASSGAQALEMLNEDIPAVLLCDLAMPDLDGWEVLRRFRRDHPAKSMAAVAISAHATREHRVRSREAGYDKHLAKPFGIDDLIYVIKSVLRSSSLEGSH
jgi:signal transduction histidine kinase/ActR/RegA family two-component response regulator